jgi:hypothetical protein
MRHTSAPRRSPQEPAKGTNAGKGSPSTPPRPPDLNRLAADLAAEWCCRHEENEVFEVAS